MEMLYLFFSFLLLLFAAKFYQSKKHLPPSPPSLPILGHLHLLKHPMHRIFNHISQKYGTIVFLRFGRIPVVLVSSSSAAKECFTKNDIVFADRPRFLLGKYISYNYTTIDQAPHGDHWRHVRRISTTELLSNHRLTKALSIRKDEIKRLIVKLSDCSLNGFSKVELKSKFQDLTMNIMIRMIAGKRYYGDDVSDDEEASQFRELMREIVTRAGASNPGDFLPILNWINGGKLEKTMIGLAKRTDKLLQGLVNERRHKKDNLDTMIDHLLSLQELEPENYSDQIIKGLIIILLFAGTESPALTLEWAMANLLNNPSTLRKARDEIDGVVGQECLLDEPDISKLPYLHNIISETHRLYPATPLLVPHMSSDDCTLGGYDIPRGTMLLVNAWAIHRDPNLWEDATNFKPERFEVEAHKLMPFGLGRRSCPGVSLAQRVMLLALGSLIQCFEWERISEEKIDMLEGNGLTMPKAEPLEAMCKPRPIVNNIRSQPLLPALYMFKGL